MAGHLAELHHVHSNERGLCTTCSRVALEAFSKSGVERREILLLEQLDLAKWRRHRRRPQDDAPRRRFTAQLSTAVRAPENTRTHEAGLLGVWGLLVVAIVFAVSRSVE